MVSLIGSLCAVGFKLTTLKEGPRFDKQQEWLMMNAR